MTIRAGILATALLVAAFGAPAPRASADEMAVCPVCNVREGTNEPEAVKATRELDGVRYAFCSKECAEEFDTDPQAYVPPVFPRPAPELALTDLAGRPMGESLRGKVLLVDFWATWCGPCKRSMPELQTLHEKYADLGFAVVGVSIDEGDPGKVKKFVESRKIHYPIALDSASDPAWVRYRVKVVPAAFLLDREGRIVAQWTGAAASAKEIEEKLTVLLAPRN